jgi:tetraacyldisaccharide 4'-kinase
MALTTQKDFVKLRAENLGGRPLRALRIGLDVMAGVEVLEQALDRVVPANRQG